MKRFNYSNEEEVYEAAKELKGYMVKMIKPTSFAELSELHPVCDETDEATIFIHEDEDMTSQIEYYHKVMVEKGLSFYNSIDISHKDKEEIKLRKIIESYKNGGIILMGVCPTLNYVAESEVAARCYMYLFQQYAEGFPIVVVEEQYNYELTRLIEEVYILCQNNWMPEGIYFKNKVIDKIIKCKEQFDKIWFEED